MDLVEALEILSETQRTIMAGRPLTVELLADREEAIRVLQGRK